LTSVPSLTLARGYLAEAIVGLPLFIQTLQMVRIQSKVGPASHVTCATHIDGANRAKPRP
jgi:hypothetical protein